MIKKGIAIILLVLCGSYLYSQTDPYAPIVDSVFKDCTEIYFKFSYNEKSDLLVFTTIVSISNVKDGEVFAYANKKEFGNFLSLHIPYVLLQHPGNQIANPKMYDGLGAKPSYTWDAYPTYDAYESMMNQYAAQYPELCKVYSLKTLSSGRKLLIAKISNHVNIHENKPQVLYLSTIHGNETSGFVHMLHLIDTLLSSYGTNQRITQLLDNVEIWINPNANPDGTYAASNGSSVAGSTRGNSNGVDLNRNYPDPVAGLHPDGEAWQPETEAFMGFADTMNFVMAATFHEGAEVCNYPWDSKATYCADDNWWQYISKEFVDTAKTYGYPGVFTDVRQSGIVNGYDWYPVNGGRQDYMNYFKQCREETIEFSSIQTPSASSLPLLWETNRRSLLNYIEQSLYGIRGIVKDSCSGQPIRAKVFVEGHDFDSSHVYSSLPVGHYNRPIYSGTYDLTYSAPGYISKTVSNLTVVNGSAVIQHVALIPSSAIIPVSGFTYSADGEVYTFSNTSINADSYEWSFGDGTTSTDQNPIHNFITSGTYTVKLIAKTDCLADEYVVDIVVIGIGILDVNRRGDINVFLNPACNKLVVSLNSDVNDHMDACIYDLLGNKVYQENNILKQGEGQVAINIDKLQAGVYIVSLKMQDYTYSLKLFKRK